MMNTFSRNAWAQYMRSMRAAVSVIAIVALILPDLALAAPRYWVGNNTNAIFNDTLNWSATEGGTGGVSAPGASDVAIFDGKAASGHVITIKQAVNIGGLILTPSWTGSVRTGTSTLIIGGTGARIGSGRLVIGTGAVMAMSGSLTMTGGVISNSLANHRWTTSGNLLHLGGNFYYSGTLVFNNNNQDQTFAYRTKAAAASQVDTNHSFSGIILNNTAGTTVDDLLVSGALLKIRNLTVTRGNFSLSHQGTQASAGTPLNVSGSITIANNAQSTFSSDTTVTISGSITANGSSSYTQTGGSTLILNGARRSQVLAFKNKNHPKITALTVTKTSSGVLAGNLTVLGTLTINTGSLLAMSGHTLYATGAAIVNYGTIKDDTGVLSHTGSSFVVGNSSFSRLETFRQGETVYVTLTDADENIAGDTKDTVTVTVILAVGGTTKDTETVTLTETEKESGIFRGSIVTANAAASSEDGTLQHTADGEISVTYTDAQDALKNSQGGTFIVTGGSSTTSGGGGGGGGRRGSLGGGGGGGVSTVPRSRPSLREVGQGTAAVARTSRDMNFEERLWSIVDRFEMRLRKRGVPEATISEKVGRLETRLQGVIERRNARLKKRGL